MKNHFGVDSRAKVLDAVSVTPAPPHDSKIPASPLHGKETHTWGDCTFTVNRDGITAIAPSAQDQAQTKKHRHRP